MIDLDIYLTIDVRLLENLIEVALEQPVNEVTIISNFRNLWLTVVFFLLFLDWFSGSA